MDRQQPREPELATSTPAILVALGAWKDDDDRELPRRGYGYKPGMTSRELYDSTRAWWHMSRSRAAGYRFVVAVHDGVIRGVWEINAASWRAASVETCQRLGRARSRWGFEAAPAPPAIQAEFVGLVIPELRSDGRRVFGSGGVIAYWPA